MSTQLETFTATIRTDTLETYINAIGKITEECKLRFGGEDEPAIRTRAVDPANVAMVEMSLEESAFESYDRFEETTVIGVNTGRMKDIIANASGDLLRIEWAGGSNKIIFSSGGLTFNMAGIDPNSVRQEPDFPDLDLPITATVTSDEISRAVNAAELVSDHIVIGGNPAKVWDGDEDQLYVNAEGDTDDVEIVWGESDIHSLSVDESAESMFSNDYMSEIASGLKGFDGDVAATVRAGEEFPMTIDWSFANGGGKGTYVLAPRIESD